MRAPPPIDLDRIACSECPAGRASCEDRGQFCPFIRHSVARGELLCLIDEPANYVWFVMDGVVGLDRSRDRGDADRVDALRMPGSFVGLECLVADRYLRSARAISRATLCGATRDGFHVWLRQSDERLAVVMRAVLEELLTAGRPDGAARRRSRLGQS